MFLSQTKQKSLSRSSAFAAATAVYDINMCLRLKTTLKIELRAWPVSIRIWVMSRLRQVSQAHMIPRLHCCSSDSLYWVVWSLITLHPRAEGLESKVWGSRPVFVFVFLSFVVGPKSRRDHHYFLSLGYLRRTCVTNESALGRWNVNEKPTKQNKTIVMLTTRWWRPIRRRPEQSKEHPGEDSAGSCLWVVDLEHRAIFNLYSNKLSLKWTWGFLLTIARKREKHFCHGVVWSKIVFLVETPRFNTFSDWIDKQRLHTDYVNSPYMDLSGDLPHKLGVY